MMHHLLQGNQKKSLKRCNSVPTAPTPPAVCACTLPDYPTTKEVSIRPTVCIVYTGLAIGGTLTAYEPTTSKIVAYKSYMQAIFPTTNYGINFNRGMQTDPSPLTAAGINFCVL